MNVYTLRNDNFQIEIARFGATLHRYMVLNGPGNIVLSRPDPTKTVTGYLGATVGRFANRIAQGAFELGNQRYQITRNENENVLHGGSVGFSEQNWEVCAANDTRVELALNSPDGDQGFPGNLAVKAVFTLLEDGLQIDYTAQSDALTICNLTSHPYFNLRGKGTVNEHVIQVPASRYTPIDSAGIPTGAIHDVTGTAMDFRRPRIIANARGEAIATGLAQSGGYDHNWVVAGSGLRNHVQLTGPDGLTLTVNSDAPAVQIYDGAHFDGTLRNDAGDPIRERGGIAIEPQGFPDAPNHSNFPSVELAPGSIYSRTIQYLVTHSQS